MSEPLDSPASCVNELIQINLEIAQFGHEWATAAGNFKLREGMVERLEAKHRRRLRGQSVWKELSNQADRDAEVRFHVEEEESTIYELLAEAEAKVEECKAKFKSLERRASNAQSMLASIRDEAGIRDFVYD